MTYLRRVTVCALTVGLFATALTSAATNCVISDQASQKQAPEDLPPFIIESSSAPAVLKLSFRKHLLFMGVGTLTFTSVPVSWAKAGIKLGDQVVEFEGHTIYGMSLHEFGALLKSKLGPLARKAVASTPIVFGVRSKETGSIRRMKLVVSHAGFTIYSYGI